LQWRDALPCPRRYGNGDADVEPRLITDWMLAGGCPKSICRVIYTTNAIESLNMSLRKVTKNRVSFPNDKSMFKLVYLALTNISKKWTMPIKRLEIGTESIQYHV
jgi:transposase-like protein